ncbi:hypothetical protein V5799_005633, partial [Amblyomma americanum]
MENSAGRLLHEEKYWLASPHPGVLYGCLSNRVTVPHAAIAQRLLYFQKGTGVLRAASFGGLATAFLDSPLRMFDLQLSRLDAAITVRHALIGDAKKMLRLTRGALPSREPKARSYPLHEPCRARFALPGPATAESSATASGRNSRRKVLFPQARVPSPARPHPRQSSTYQDTSATMRIHAHSRVYISSHRYLVAADSLLGKFGRRQLLEQSAWWFALICSMMASRKARLLIEGIAEGSEVLKTARCIDLATAWFGTPLYYTTDTEHFTAEKRRAMNTFLHGPTKQTLRPLTATTWIDERTRRLMERKLRDLRVVAWLEQLQRSAATWLGQSSEAFPNFWEDPKKQEFLENWIAAASQRLRENGAGRLLHEKYGIASPHSGVVYGCLSNRVTVLHAAVAQPLFHFQKETGVLRTASFRGLATAFLDAVVRIFDLQLLLKAQPLLPAGILVDRRSSLSLYAFPVPNESTIARHLSIERVVLATLSTGINETGRAAANPTVVRLEPLFRNLNGYPLPKAILSAFNASGIHAQSRVYITSLRYLVAEDWLLGKFGRRQLREHIAWWFTQICAVMASRKAKMLIAGDAEGSEVLKTARCIDLATAWFGPALYYMTDTQNFTAEMRRAANSFLHGVTLQTQSSLKAITCIDERTRRIMERSLRDLRVLAWLELLQNSAAPGLDQSSGAFSNFWEDPKKSGPHRQPPLPVRRGLALGKFGRQQLLEHIARWLAQICALIASRKARLLFAGDAEGSEVLKTARCIDLATAWFSPTLYLMTDTEYFTSEKRRTVNSFLHVLTSQTQRTLTAVTLYGAPVPNESTIARQFSIERVVLGMLSTGVNETGRAAVHTTVARPEPLFSNLSGYPVSKTILSTFNASGIHAHSRVYISSRRRYLVAADWLLGKFGRQQLLEHSAWWFALICAMMASRMARLLIAGDAEGSEVLKAARCIDLAMAWFGTPLYYTTDTEYFTTEKRRAVSSFLHGPTKQTLRILTATTWIDKRTRRLMERKLRDLRVVAWLEQLQSSAAPGLGQSSEAFPNFWEDPNKEIVEQEFLENWIAAASQRLGENGAGRLLHEEMYWLALPHPAVVYGCLSNRVTVLHAAVAQPLFHFQKETGVLRTASFGGLATTFLDAVVRIFDLQSTIARHLSIERMVLATLSTGINETGRAAANPTVVRLEPLFRNLNGYPLPKAILSAINASGIHAHSRVYIRSRRYLVAADWLLGKFGRRQPHEHIAWWFTQICAVMASRKPEMLIAGEAEGSEVLKTARCIDLATAWFGPVLYYMTDTQNFTAEMRMAVNSFLHGVTLQTQSSLKAITCVEERTRRIMERSLRDLRVLAWLELLQNSAAPGLDQSSGAFSNFWEDPKKHLKGLLRITGYSSVEKHLTRSARGESVEQEFLENCIAAASQRLRENGAGRLLHLENYWLASPHPGVLYGCLSNRVTVLHAAVAQLLFHFQKGTGVLRAASFGGLAIAFLDAKLTMFDLQ